MPFTVYYNRLEFDEETEEYKDLKESFTYEDPMMADPSGKAEIFNQNNPTLYEDVLGDPPPDYMRISDDDQKTLDAFIPALRNAGITSCLVSYDGGSDEGFARFESLTHKDGTIIELDDLLGAPGFLAAVTPFVIAQRAANKHPVYRGKDGALAPKDMAKDHLDFSVPTILVSRLIGNGFGTGEYQLYGRARVDLETMTITDDPKAPYSDGASL
jgi:hypothetical protein